MSEKALTEEERQENRQTRAMAGLRRDLPAGQQDNFEALPETSVSLNLAVGEGHRTLSWIWYTTTSKKMDDDHFADACERIVPPSQ